MVEHRPSFTPFGILKLNILNTLFALLKIPMKTILPSQMQVTAGAATVLLRVEHAAETTAAVLSIATGVGVPGGTWVRQPSPEKTWYSRWFDWIIGYIV